MSGQLFHPAASSATTRLWATKAEAEGSLPLAPPSPTTPHTPSFFRIPDFYLWQGLPAGCPAGSFRFTVRISNQVGHKASIHGPSPCYKNSHKGAGQPHNRHTNEQTLPAPQTHVRTHSLQAVVLGCSFLENFS